MQRILHVSHLSLELRNSRPKVKNKLIPVYSFVSLGRRVPLGKLGPGRPQALPAHVEATLVNCLIARAKVISTTICHGKSFENSI